MLDAVGGSAQSDGSDAMVSMAVCHICRPTEEAKGLGGSCAGSRYSVEAGGVYHDAYGTIWHPISPRPPQPFRGVMESTFSSPERMTVIEMD